MTDVQVLGVRPRPAVDLVGRTLDGQSVRTTRHSGYVDLIAPYKQVREEISFWLPDSRAYGIEAKHPSAVVSALVLPAGESTSIPETRVIVHDTRAWFAPHAPHSAAHHIGVSVRLETWRFSSSVTFVLGYQVECLVPVLGQTAETAGPQLGSGTGDDRP